MPSHPKKADKQLTIMIKAIFFDIDGTLVSFRTHCIPDSALRALGALREKGIRLFIASGRHPSDIFTVSDFPFDGYVALNGGYCIAGSGEVIFRQEIDPSDIERMIRWQQGPEKFACVLAGEREMCLNFVDERVTRVRKLVETGHPAPVAPFEEWSAIARRGVLQLIAFFGPEREAEIMGGVFPHCRSMRWNPLFTDIVPAGVNKAEGIDRMLEHFGLRLEEVMAFGDGGNDIPMLEHVGTSVAMGNADPAVKKAADYVTTSPDDHGIARALRRFGLIE